jgi:hypothetical protein
MLSQTSLLPKFPAKVIFKTRIPNHCFVNAKIISVNLGPVWYDSPSFTLKVCAKGA